MEKLNWYFASNGNSIDDGINNSMIEQFKDDINYSLAREIIQNSLDAKNEEDNNPVRVKFTLEKIKKNEFPGYEQLHSVFKSSIEEWHGHEEAVTFLINALEVLSKDTIPILKISDYNTKGLNGTDSDKNGGWYNLVRSRGATNKTEGGGSFGIGKGAPFAASELRTVYYSTKNEKSESVFQGVAELVSHKEDGDLKRGVGIYGRGYESVRKPELMPNGFWRKEQGTDIHIAGYKAEKKWDESLIKSVLRNFWYSILKKELIVEIEKTIINHSTLEDLLSTYFLGEPFKDYVEPKGNPLQYYLAIKNGEVTHGSLKTIGNVSFYFNQIPEHLNYVAMLRRNHMVIYSRRFNFPANFAGVFICDDITGDKLLRKLEPPSHNDWKPDRLADKGSEILEEITFFIRNTLESFKQTNEFAEVEFPEMYKYLPFDEGENAGNEKGDRDTDNSSAEETQPQIQKQEAFERHSVIQPTKIAVLNKPDTGDADGGTGRGDSDGGGGNGGGGGGGGKKKSFSRKDFNCRSFAISKNDSEANYTLLVKSKITGKANLKIYAQGEESQEKIKLISIKAFDGNKYVFSGNQIMHVHLKENETTKIEIKIQTPIYISLKIEAYDLQ